MKRLLLSLLGLSMFLGTASGATFNLKASWTPNEESDMKEYRLYRTDSGRALLGVVPHPGTSLSFSLTVPKNYPKDLTFVLTAVDQFDNESPDSDVSACDITPPSAPKNVKKK